ncbi:MAG: hypothetical protein ABH815_04555 [Candidatus Omnitrophota bacterium]
MKKLAAFCVIILVIFVLLLVKSKAFLIYRVTEFKKGSAHTSRRVFFDREAFLDYIKRTPDRITGGFFSGTINASSGLKLTNKEQESVKKLIKDSGVLTGNIDINQKIKDLVKNYKDMTAGQGQ